MNKVIYYIFKNIKSVIQTVYIVSYNIKVNI